MTDGSVRDTGVLRDYGFPVFSISTTPARAPTRTSPGPATPSSTAAASSFRPGDAIVGDDDGCVVIPAAVAQEVYDIAHSREVVEDIVKEEPSQNPGPLASTTPLSPARSSPTPPWPSSLSPRAMIPRSSRTPPRAPAPAPASASPAPPAAASSPAPALPATTPPLPTLATTTRRRLRRDEVLRKFAEHKACAVLRTPIEGACTPAMDAAVAGGFKLAEFTLTTPGASTPSRSTRALAPTCSPAWALS